MELLSQLTSAITSSIPGIVAGCLFALCICLPGRLVPYSRVLQTVLPLVATILFELAYMGLYAWVGLFAIVYDYDYP
jgi:low affinity Fe/Cu permease